MDIVSLPVYRRVRADLRLMLLVVALAMTVLVLLVAGGLDPSLLEHPGTDEPLMAPFRWWSSNGHTA